MSGVWRGHLCHSKRNGVQEIQLLIKKDTHEGLTMIPQRQIIEFIKDENEIQMMDEDDRQELEAFIKRESDIQTKVTTYEQELRRCYNE